MRWFKVMTRASDDRGPIGPTSPVEGDAARLGAGTERRLHPLSWIFVLLRQLKGFALPLVALLVLGRSQDTGQWWGLVAVGVLTLAAVARYYTYRFRIDADELVIRSGLLQRNVRHMPLAQIQTVTLHRNLLHRIAGVAEVRLESAAGGDDPEARMQVLSMADANALERLVERRRGAAAQADSVAAAVTPIDVMGPLPADTARVLLRLAPLEVIKLGVASNRDTVLLFAAAGVLANFAGGALLDRFGPWLRQAMAWLEGLGLPMALWVALVLVALVAVIVTGRVLAIVLALLRNFDFTLEKAGNRLSVERGLLTRVRASAPLPRIQRWTLRQGVVLRFFDRRRLTVETAAQRHGRDQETLSELAPIAPPALLESLLRECLPDWPNALEFHPLHPRAWRRICIVPCVLTLLACALLVAVFGLVGLLLVALLPCWIALARRQAAASGYAITDTLLFWRSGWLDQQLSFARIEKLQGLRWVQSPFDRRHGMASLRADTAGAHPFGHRLHLRYLPEAEARRVFGGLAERLAGTNASG